MHDRGPEKSAASLRMGMSTIAVGGVALLGVTGMMYL
jgi:hypothetical protein